MAFQNKMMKRTSYTDSVKQNSNSGSLSFGSFGVKAIYCNKSFPKGVRLTNNQIESMRKVIMRNLRILNEKNAKLWINVHSHVPVTKKSIGVRMGGGKGAIDHHVAVLKNGQVIFELSNVSEENAKTALLNCFGKVAFTLKFVKRKFCFN